MQIIRKLEDLRTREHMATVEIVEALVECARSEAYLELGYGSIWEFLVQHLKYSNAAASRRYKAMKCAQRFPRVLEMLREHRTNLSALAMAEATLVQSHSAEELLGQIEGKSQREVERVIAQQHPVPPRRETVRRQFVRPATTEDGLFAALPAEERVFLSFSISPEQNAALGEAKALMASKYPQGQTLEGVFEELLTCYLKMRRPKTRAAEAKATRRRIGKPVRDQVFLRDGGSCSFVSAAGRRCGSTHALQIDHVRPWAMGGSSELDNLRLLCGRHNRHRARQSFGATRVPQRN